MSVVGHTLLVALGWVLLGYAVYCLAIFTCLMVMAFAALLGWEPRGRMPTESEWERTLAVWTREIDERNGKKRREE